MEEKRRTEETQGDHVIMVSAGERRNEVGALEWKFKDVYTKYPDRERETKEGFSNIDGN